MLDLATSVVPYLGLSVLMYLALGVSHLLALALAVPAAGFAVRTFIVFHDCSHGSFLPSRRANAWLGAALGVLLYSPFLRWRHDHAIHHATSGDLDRRGGGDVWTLTVAEYVALTPRRRLGYRAFRNPLVMFGLGPIFAMIVAPRFVARSARPRMRRSVIGTDIALVLLVGGLCWLIGWRDYLLVWAPSAWLPGACGIWLFYVQHQFEDTYWQNRGTWSYADAALRGSSHLRLPKVLQLFTGNIGLHHVHHLNALPESRREPGRTTPAAVRRLRARATLVEPAREVRRARDQAARGDAARRRRLERYERGEAAIVLLTAMAMIEDAGGPLQSLYYCHEAVWLDRPTAVSGVEERPREIARRDFRTVGVGLRDRDEVHRSRRLRCFLPWARRPRAVGDRGVSPEAAGMYAVRAVKPNAAHAHREALALIDELWRRRCSSTVRSAVGTASSRSSGIGSPLSIESSYVPAASRASARSRAARSLWRSSARPASNSSW